jgi:hypothetical protein
MHIFARPSALAHIAPLLAALYFWTHGSLGHGLVSSVFVSRQARIFESLLTIGQCRFAMALPDSVIYPKPPGQERPYPKPTKIGKTPFKIPG